MNSTTPRRNRAGPQRPSKRIRRMDATHDASRTPQRQQTTTPNTAQRRSRTALDEKSHMQSKRRRNTPTPSSCRKRRRSVNETYSPVSDSSKKARLFKPDVEMVDASIKPSDTPSQKKRKKILKEILRSEKINRATLRNLNINADIAPQQHKAEAGRHAHTYGDDSTAHTQYSDRHVRRALWEDPVVLTGDEEVEEVDISQCSETEREQFSRGTAEQDSANPMQTYLAEDGRCFVRIAREDGAIDYYVLYPHSQSQEYYYEY